MHMWFNQSQSPLCFSLSLSPAARGGNRTCWAVREIPCCVLVELVLNALVLNSAFLRSAHSHASFMKQAVAEIHTPSIQHVPSSSTGSSIIYGFLSGGRMSSLRMQFSCRYCWWPTECANAIRSTGPLAAALGGAGILQTAESAFSQEALDSGVQPKHCSTIYSLPLGHC